MPEKISNFFNSDEPKGKIHTCILICILFITMAAIQIILYFFKPGHHIPDHIALAAVNVIIAVSAAITAIHTDQKARSEKEN